MSRYAFMGVKRVRRWYRRTFDCFKFNCRMLSNVMSISEEKIAALDASFMTKRGKNADGLGLYWRGCKGQAERGLELSLLGVVDLQSNTAYALEA